MRFWKRFCFVLVLVMALAVCAGALAANTSGKCGKNVTWTLKNGTLTISGKGAMENYANGAPWDSAAVKKIVIKSGVTSIGNYAFSGCTSLKRITISKSVTSIGKYAFFWCDSLKKITMVDCKMKLDT